MSNNTGNNNLEISYSYGNYDDLYFTIDNSFDIDFIDEIINTIYRNLRDDIDYVYIDNVLSSYRLDDYENVLNQSFEETTSSISKNENLEINLDQFTYTKLNVDEMCTICLNSLETGELVCRLNCSHTFHFDCVNEWCKYKSQCPMCRDDVEII